MDRILIPGTTIEHPTPSYSGYMSPTDEVILNVAYLVDAGFRRAIKNQNPAKTPENETIYANVAKKRLGISFGTEYRFPPGMNAQSFQLYCFKCFDFHSIRNGNPISQAEYKNLDRLFSVLKDLNPAEFKKLENLNLSEKDKADVILGVCSKLTMTDITHFIRLNQTKGKREIVPNICFLMSPETKTKANDFLEQHDASLGYLSNFWERPEYRDVPDQDLKIRGLLARGDDAIATEIKKNPDRFFTALEKSSNPADYARQIIRSCFSPNDQDTRQDILIWLRLSKIKRRALLQEAVRKRAQAAQPEVRTPAPTGKRPTLFRKGISGLLNLADRTLPPTATRRAIKKGLVNGYRFFSPKNDPDR